MRMIGVASPDEASGCARAPLAPMGQAGLAGCTRSCPLLPGSLHQQYSIPRD